MKLKRNVYPLSKSVEIIKKELNKEFSLDDLLDLAYNDEIEVCHYFTGTAGESSDEKILLNFRCLNTETQEFLQEINGLDSIDAPEDMLLHMVFSNYCGMFMSWFNITFSESKNFFSLNLLSCSMPLKVKASQVRLFVNGNYNPIDISEFSICKSDNLRTKLLEKDVEFLGTISITPEIRITLDNLSITANELEDFIYKHKKEDPEFRLLKHKNDNSLQPTNRPGLKSHHLQGKVIAVAQVTKDFYLNKGIDLGLMTIAKKIKQHTAFKDKGLPASKQIAVWLTDADIPKDKPTTRPPEFELKFPDDYYT